MIAPVWIIGFTGHRPKDAPGRTSAAMEHLAPKIREELQALLAKAKQQGGRAELLCGVAAGADLIAAREASALGMAVHVILPMPESHFAEDFAGAAFEDDWKEAQQYCRLANEGIGGATFRIANSSHLRDDCYYDLGSQIVYASDAVIALWDGTEAPPIQSDGSGGKIISHGRGGTADVISLAEADRMPYLKGRGPKHGYQWLPTPVRRINTITQEVDGDASNFASDHDAGLAEMKAIAHAASMEHGKHAPPLDAKGLMDFVDRGAKDWASRLRQALLWGSGLHFVAALIAAISASAQKVTLDLWLPSRLAGIELSLVLLAIALLLWSHWKHAQARWLELRLATELTRGLVAAQRLIDPLFPVVTDHLPGWRRFCLSVGLIVWKDSLAENARRQVITANLSPGEQLEAEKSRYKAARIREQLDYFRKNDPKQRHNWYHLANCAGPVTSMLAVGFILNALLHKIHEANEKLANPGGTPASLTFSDTVLYYFLPIALPLLAAAIASLQSVTDVKRRGHVYPQMIERLQSSALFLDSIRTTASLRRFARRTEQILLDELVGWYAAAKGISH